jgi:hypothetical protein
VYWCFSHFGRNKYRSVTAKSLWTTMPDIIKSGSQRDTIPYDSRRYSFQTARCPYMQYLVKVHRTNHRVPASIQLTQLRRIFYKIGRAATYSDSKRDASTIVTCRFYAKDMLHESVNDPLTSSLTHSNRFSAAFQLMTSQIAPKYSAFRFWY